MTKTNLKLVESLLRVPEKPSAVMPQSELTELNSKISRASELILSQQRPESYWWYTLEANQSIGAEFILLMHYMDDVDLTNQAQIVRSILESQRDDGAWSLYYDDLGDLSTTIECYFALKIAGISTESHVMKRARKFILSQGGLSQCRIFTRILLAQFGLLPWKACPEMPIHFIHAPVRLPINIYEFSSWARACIVPLLVILDIKKVVKICSDDFLDELYLELKHEDITWSFTTDKSFFSLDNFFIQTDQILKVYQKLNKNLLKKRSRKKCENWIRDHVAKTEDIYPALAFSAMALSSLGYKNSDPSIEKCMKALRKFQMPESSTVPALPDEVGKDVDKVYQQCCVSPVWDTPWAGMALLEAGESPSKEALLNAGRWLLDKQVTETYGDWSQKNKKGRPGGWSFEFENEYFPDVDDTVEVLFFLKNLDLSPERTRIPIQRGLDWILSMQSKNGGWAAFDVNNTKKIVNHIPFSDHGACLDPPTADITGRVLELLASFNYRKDVKFVEKAIRFLEKDQEDNGAWWGRWGVNYLYGTWCALQGLEAIGYEMKSENIHRALLWLKLVQRPDGGYGESCASYKENKFMPLNVSVPSQTAWALMALIAGGQGLSEEAHAAANFLIKSQNVDGSWDEEHFTGTGFPGYFYIRYHGYRHYFPLMALAKYRKQFKV